MDTQRTPRAPIFTDESGHRAAVLQWLARGLCLSCALLAGAVAFTLLTHVPLPGLGGLLEPETTARTRPNDMRDRADERTVTGEGTSGSARDRASAGGAATSAGVRNRSAAANADVAGAGTAPQSVPTQAVGTHPPTPASTPNENASTKGPNPHAATKSPNPHSADKTRNPRAVAGSANARPAAQPTSTPPAPKGQPSTTR